MANDMTPENRTPTPLPQDDSGVGTPLAETTPEQQIQHHKANHSFFSVEGLQRSGPVPNSAIESPTESLHGIDRQYETLLRSIAIFKRDLGYSSIEIASQEKTIPHPQNVRKSGREKLIKNLEQERQTLAVLAFPRYMAIWRETDSQNEAIARSYENRFDEAGEKGIHAQVAVVVESRSQLSTILSVKATYYTEMLTTLLIDRGIPPEEAEEKVYLATSSVSGVSSIPEKAERLRDLKAQAVDSLVEHIDTTIEAWDALYPGLGEEEEIRIMNSPADQKTKLAKVLYKKVYDELERRRDEYRDRYYRQLNEQGGVWGPEARSQAQTLDQELRRLPRADQAIRMRSEQPIP